MALNLSRYINKYIDPVKVIESGCAYLYETHKYSYPQAIIWIAVVPGYKFLFTLRDGVRVEKIERIKWTSDIGYLIKKFPEDVDPIAESVLNTLLRRTKPTQEEIALLRDESQVPPSESLIRQPLVSKILFLEKLRKRFSL